MNKQDYFAWGERQARKDWAQGRGPNNACLSTSWRDTAYRDGYSAAWKELEQA